MLATTLLLLLVSAAPATALRVRQDGGASATDLVPSGAGSSSVETSAITLAVPFDLAQASPTSVPSSPTTTATELLLATTVEEALRSSASLTRPLTKVSSAPAVVAPSNVPAQKSTSSNSPSTSEAPSAPEAPSRGGPAPAPEAPSKGGGAAPAPDMPSKSDGAPASDASSPPSDSSGAGALVVPGALVAAAVVAAAVF
ncbi:uncharacterized protein LOC62_02G003126 [Vanrija pseudolonga]|uniref:Uncharacterized protein n=1 Tax=Vanrija pseudolonga TaxID=143232 RepID=A0AAF0Y7Q4_9TREE|nr:hypothetical protein LOC62_02G003126 [Vanrija pseudolonga]